MEIETFEGFIKNKNLDEGTRYLYRKREMSANFGDFCYDEMLEDCFNGTNYSVNFKPLNVLEENLKSHNWKLLRKQLLKLFPDNILEVRLDDGIDNGDYSYVIVKTQDIEKLKSDEKFNELLLFFNYFITYTTPVEIYLEPMYSEKVDLSCKYLYHLTKKKYVENIKKKRYTMQVRRNCMGSCHSKKRCNKIQTFPKKNIFVCVKK